MSRLATLGAGARAFYQGLSDRDQLVLRWSLPVVLVLLVYLLLIAPLASRYQSLAAEHQRLSEELTWIMAQRDFIARLQSPCPGSAEIADRSSALALINAQVRRRGLDGQPQPAGNGYSLRLRGASGNAVLGLIGDLSCRGLVLERFDIQTTDAETNLVNAEAWFRLP